jgi:hypothetical protein
VPRRGVLYGAADEGGGELWTLWAATGPPCFSHVGSCLPAGSPGGPSTTCYGVSCEPEPGGLRVGLCLGWAKFSCPVLSH